MTTKTTKLLSVLMCISYLLSAMTTAIYAQDSTNAFDLRSLENNDWNKSYASVITNMSTGIGGRDDLGDDYFALKSARKYASSNSARWKYSLDGVEKQTYTWEADVLVTEGAVANMGFGSYSVLVMNDSLIKGQVQGATLENPTVANKPNQWHRVALSYDSEKRQMQSYVDGNQVGIVTSFDFDKLAYAAFSMDIGLSEVGSMIVYDNAIMYHEPYDPSKHLGMAPQITLISDATGAELTSDLIIYDYEVITDVSELIPLIDAGDSTFNIYTDSTCTEVAQGELSGKECVAVESADGMFSYYFVKKASIAIYGDEVEFVTDGSKIGAKARFVNTSSDDGSVVMIMVFKNENGVIEKLAASSEIPVPKRTENPDDAVVEIEPVSTDGCTPEVFFIKSWSGRQRLFDEIYKPQ